MRFSKNIKRLGPSRKHHLDHRRVCMQGPTRHKIHQKYPTTTTSQNHHQFVPTTSPTPTTPQPLTHTTAVTMPYFKTGQEWMEQSALLIEARPKTVCSHAPLQSAARSRQRAAVNMSYDILTSAKLDPHNNKILSRSCSHP